MICSTLGSITSLWMITPGYFACTFARIWRSISPRTQTRECKLGGGVDNFVKNLYAFICQRYFLPLAPCCSLLWDKERARSGLSYGTPADTHYSFFSTHRKRLLHIFPSHWFLFILFKMFRSPISKMLRMTHIQKIISLKKQWKRKQKQLWCQPDLSTIAADPQSVAVFRN